MPPLLNPGQQLTAIDERASVDHATIVETATWRTEADTRRFAARLARSPALRDCFIELQGELGAGKTTFVRHLLHSLGVEGRIKSPTYAVVEPYELDDAQGMGPLSIWHFDFYRFDDPREWEDAGFRDIFAMPGLKLAEWPDKARTVLPRSDLVLTLVPHADNSRVVNLRAQTDTGRMLMGPTAR